MKKILSFIILAVVITGCSSTKPILNLQNEPVSEDVSISDVTQIEVQEVILAAGAKLGWTGEVIEPGLIDATLQLRTHEAVVEIAYSDKQYSINYKSSKNLKYKDGNIHKNYNRWVANLSKTIKEQVIYRASLTGDEAIVNTSKGMSIWEVDGDRKVSAIRIMSTGVGLNSVLFSEGTHTIGGMVVKRQLKIGSVDYKAKHEYLIDYVIEDKKIYYWVKDLTDNVVVYGTDRKSQ
jgi:hypothetical protein